MNTFILDIFKDDDLFHTILPHQLATLDYLIKVMIKDNKNILEYHGTGSGKTIIGLILAILMSVKQRVIIILPNQNILRMWELKLIEAIALTQTDMNVKNIEFITSSNLCANVENNNVIVHNRILEYDNTIMILDEAHHTFGTRVGALLVEMQKNIRTKYLLLTASPISNTPETIIDIIQILTGELIQKNVLINVGKFVYQSEISKDGEGIIQSKLINHISYYDMELDILPPLYYYGELIFNMKVVICYMDPIQEHDYLLAKQKKTE